MRRIELTTAFKRDYKREIKGKYKIALEKDLPEILVSLSEDRDLPKRCHDHGLTGEWKDFRDCHVKPDLVLIYKKISTDCLQLVRIGSHSELGW